MHIQNMIMNLAWHFFPLINYNKIGPNTEHCGTLKYYDALFFFVSAL